MEMEFIEDAYKKVQSLVSYTIAMHKPMVNALEGEKTNPKILQMCFYWPMVFKDA